MRRRAPILVIVGATMMLGLIASATVVHLVRGGESANQVAVAVLEADARGAESALDRLLLQVDSAIAGIPVHLLEKTDADAGQLVDAANLKLRKLVFELRWLKGAMLVASDGGIWASTVQNADRKLAGVDPAIFSESLLTETAALVGPIRDRSTGEKSIFVTRAVFLPGLGRMVAVAQIAVRDLVALMSDGRLNTAAKITVERKSGEVIATVPYDGRAVGLVRPSSALRDLEPIFETGRRAGGDPAVDGHRHAAFGRVFVVRTSGIEGALGDWHKERDRTVGVALLASAMVLVAAAALLLLLRHAAGIAEERARVATNFENAIEGMADGFVMWDADDRLVTCNEVFRDIYSLTRPVLVPGARFEEIMRFGIEVGQYPTASERPDEFLREIVSWHRGGKGSLERLLPDGRWILISERRLTDGGSVGIRTDITALKTAQAKLATATDRANRAAESVREQNNVLQERDRELHAQNTLFQAALNNMSHGLLMVDRSGRLIVANPRFADLFGITALTLVAGLTIEDLLASVRAVGTFDPEALEDLHREQSKLAAAKAWGTFVTVSAKDRVIAVTQRPLGEGGWVAIYEDVTSQRRAERRVHFLAHHDDLTKLPNRAQFRAHLDECLFGRRRASRGSALLYLDLDGFKDVNDTFGHQAGDTLLEEVARRLRATLGEGEFVARLGGDEFAAICDRGSTDAEIIGVGEAMIAALSRPFELPAARVMIGASVGIARLRGTDAEELLRNADLALYQAKSSGRGRCCLFDPAMEQRRRRRVVLEQDLREALAGEAFAVHYQPIFDLQLNRVCGFEALIRWPHADRGWVNPSEFIPVAEEVGLVDAIGRWMLHTACREIGQLPEPIRVAVNLSAHQLRSDDVVDDVQAALRESGLAPSRLELEITETALLAENNTSADILQRLSGLGVRIALDDFGTGYSSLSHLRNYPLDKIKIDKSFVGEMTSNRDSAAIVRAVIDLAARLGMRTTAEGVETDAQLRAIRVAGCTEAQGFLLGKPRAILHAVEVLRAAPPAPLGTPRRRRSA